MSTESTSEDPETEAESEGPLMLILAVGGILLFGVLLGQTPQAVPVLGFAVALLVGLLFPLLVLYLLWRLVVAVERLADAAEAGVIEERSE